MEHLGHYWIFSSNEPGKEEGNDWDTRTILSKKRYYLKVKEKSRSRVQTGDVCFIRVYGDGFWGKFTIAGGWKEDPQARKKYGLLAGYFPMIKIVRWKRSLPYNLIWPDLSTKDVRSRIAKITETDAFTIECGNKMYERLGFGAADGEVIILEKGLEEAMKPNLDKMGLRLAGKDIREQFSMPGAGRSDLICLDEKDNLVVIELKRGRSSNEVVGQVLTYVGYLKENVAGPGQEVKGWIITGSYDESLRLAASAAGVKVLVVRLP